MSRCGTTRTSVPLCCVLDTTVYIRGGHDAHQIVLPTRNDAAVQKAEHLSKTCGVKAKAYQVDGNVDPSKDTEFKTLISDLQ